MAKTPINYYVTFDLETTGLSAEKHSLIEIACVVMDKELEVVEEYESGIIQPLEGREITEGALKANGLTREQLSKGKLPKTAITEFIAFLKSLSKKKDGLILCGHNIDNFDIPFLVNWFEAHNKNLGSYVNDKFTIDTMWWARVRWNESQNYKLGTCCTNAEISLVDAHRALNDTRANAKLVKYFIEHLRGKGVSDKKEERFRVKFEI